MYIILHAHTSIVNYYTRFFSHGNRERANYIDNIFGRNSPIENKHALKNQTFQPDTSWT